MFQPFERPTEKTVEDELVPKPPLREVLPEALENTLSPRELEFLTKHVVEGVPLVDLENTYQLREGRAKSIIDGAKRRFKRCTSNRLLRDYLEE